MTLVLRNRPSLVGKPRFKVESKGGSILLRRTRSTIGTKSDQQQAVRNLRSRKMHTHTVIAKGNPTDWGDYEIAKHLFSEVATFTFDLPAGKYTLFETGPKASFISLGDGGMKGTDRHVHIPTGDVSIEVDGGEYLQWHTEESLDSIWWSCSPESIAPTLDLIIELDEEPDMEISGAIHLLEGESPLMLSGREVVKYARDNLDEIDFFVVDYQDFSLSWMSSNSPGRERADSGHGEVSLVYRVGSSGPLARILEKTATPAIKKHAGDIVAGINQRRLPQSLA